MKTTHDRYTRNPATDQGKSPARARNLRIGVTGAGGFIGLNLVDTLCAKGYDVSCLTLPGERLRCAARPKTVVGDILDPVSLEPFVADRDVIVHLAGLTRAKSERGFFRVNVDGTRALFEAALRSGSPVRRIVAMSSQSVVGPTPAGEIHDERAGFNPLTPYARSKAAAELVAREYSGSLPHTIIRAPAVYGPFDRDFITLVRFAERGISLVMGNDSRFSHVFVRNLVHGIELAIGNAAAMNETFFLADEGDSTWRTFGEAIGAALDKRTRVIKVPYPLIAAAGFLGSALQLVWPKPLLITMHKLRELKQSRWLGSIAKASSLLGYKPPFAFAEAIGQTVGWYRERGMV